MKTSLVKITVVAFSLAPVFSSTSKPSSTRFRACVDNSDCANLGYAYACFLYMCYPWEHPESPDHPNCNSDSDCWGGEGKCKWDQR